MTYPSLGPKIPGDDYAVLRAALEMEPEGWALEFGTGSGATTRLIAERMPVVSYDSFLGLPEDWRPDFPAGFFAQADIPSIENATVVVGLFEDTLPAFDWPETVGLVHIDCDLESSTRTVLEHAGHLIQPGVVVVLDEFHGYTDDHTGEVPGEQRAWMEFAGKVGLAWDTIGHGREQWACLVTARMLP